MEDAAPRGDIFVTATGNIDVITLDHMRAMKDRAIVCNIGHFDSEIQVAALRNYSGTTSSRRSTRSSSPTASGSSCWPRAGWSIWAAPPAIPSFVMSTSFTNQTLAQIELWTNAEQLREQGLHPAQAARREGRRAAPREARREADQAHARAGGLHRRHARGSVQARAVPLLSATSAEGRSCRTSRRRGRSAAGLAAHSAGRRSALEGDLGAGKTELARSVIRALAGADHRGAQPDLHTVAGVRAAESEVTHADLYRLADPDEVAELGLEEAWAAGRCWSSGRSAPAACCRRSG